MSRATSLSWQYVCNRCDKSGIVAVKKGFVFHDLLMATEAHHDAQSPRCSPSATARNFTFSPAPEPASRIATTEDAT